jgi:hypothetical protein
MAIHRESDQDYDWHTVSAQKMLLLSPNASHPLISPCFQEIRGPGGGRSRLIFRKVKGELSDSSSHGESPLFWAEEDKAGQSAAGGAPVSVGRSEG